MCPNSLCPNLHLQGRLVPQPAQQERPADGPGPLLALRPSPRAPGFSNNIDTAHSPSLRGDLLDGGRQNEDQDCSLHFRRPWRPTCPLGAGRSVSAFPVVCSTSKARLSRQEPFLLRVPMGQWDGYWAARTTEPVGRISARCQRVGAADSGWVR